ncbi:hypothetical protein KJK00_27480, partial [Klebsiella quasipneumoniae]|uniref:hypothetical protein n=1 Tax=Klebsiella quasipneumoniae TaxID=1463165 RepID=UPI001BD92BD5
KIMMLINIGNYIDIYVLLIYLCDKLLCIKINACEIYKVYNMLLFLNNMNNWSMLIIVHKNICMWKIIMHNKIYACDELLCIKYMHVIFAIIIVHKNLHMACGGDFISLI